MKPLIQGTQGSNHTSTNSSSPIMKHAPFRTTSLVFSIAFQMRDAFLAASVLNQSSFTLYFTLRILIQRLSLLDAIIHANFASKAEFMNLDFLNPKPPSLLGQYKLSQDFQARNLPSCLFGFHENLLIRPSILLHTLFGIKKEDIVEISIDSATEFIKALLPAHERHLLLHPDSYASILSSR